MTKCRSKEEWIKLGREVLSERRKRIKRVRSYKFDTIATHGIYDMSVAMKENSGSIIEPVYLSSAQTYNDSYELEVALAYEMPAWIYARFGNPSSLFLEETIALLESYETEHEASCLATGSGISAIHMAVEPFLVKDGRLNRPNIVATAKIYGGTFQLFNVRLMQERGIEVRWVRNGLDLDEWRSKIDDQTRLVYGEMPSNPAVAVFDIAEVANVAHRNGVPFIVDATCASPALTRPLQFGADIVVQSASKVISSNGTTIIGTVTSRKNIVSKIGCEEMKEDFALWVKLHPFRDYGPAIHPMGALLTLSDLRTLRMRVAHMSRSAMSIAKFLESHPNVERVYYPGLKSYEGHEVAKKYMTLADTDENLYGYMMAFDIKEDKKFDIKNARKFHDALHLIWRATDLGRVKTIATLPAISTHQQQGEEGREVAGILPSCVRLSVGIEDVEDLLKDLERSLDAI
jgi:O-acetylhomoserine/O-acetylserine sulfhydrylase-like pyridoxal-dependent enzyme